MSVWVNISINAMANINSIIKTLLKIAKDKYFGTKNSIERLNNLGDKRISSIFVGDKGD